MESINWLHLTDLHHGMNSQGWLWPTVREEFYLDLKRLHNKSGPWDLVLFTGDLAYSGKKEEYEALNQLLEELWEQFESLDSNPILLPIPGNHDLLRPNALTGAVRTLKQWRGDEELREFFWSNEDNEFRQVITNAFSAFMEWRHSSPIVPEAKFNQGIIPGDFSYTLEKGDLRLGVIGLNTSFLQLGGGDYEGLLDLDIRQLHEVCNGDAVKWIKAHHSVLLLTHHPYSWLRPQSQDDFKSEIYTPNRFVVHIFGHMHEHSSKSISIGGSEPRRFLQGTSLFGMETWGDGTKRRVHGYSAGRLSAEGDKGTLQIWPRQMDLLDDGHRKIIPYHKFDLGDDDSIAESIKLSKSLAISVVIPASPEEVLIATPPLQKIVEHPSITKSYDLSNYVFFVPYEQKGSRVIGREEDLKKLGKQLANGQRTGIRHGIVIEGFGGLGKTQLAVEYAYDFKETYTNGVIWINVDQDIETQLIELVDKGGWIAPESEHKDKLAVARQRLRTPTPIVL